MSWWPHCYMRHSVIPQYIYTQSMKDIGSLYDDYSQQQCQKKTLALKQLSDPKMKYYGFHQCKRHPTHRQGGILDHFYHNFISCYSIFSFYKSTNNIYKTYWRTDSTMAKIKSIKVQTTSTKHSINFWILNDWINKRMV
jgi:hypothetical protein